jgi:hypothetical protein
MLFAAVAALGVIGSAKASTVGTEPIGLATNDIVGPQTGYFGANLYASGALTIEYTYLGKEAGFDNAFLVLGNTKFDTNTTSPGSTAFETLAAAGQLNFSFNTNLPAGGLRLRTDLTRILKLIRHILAPISLCRFTTRPA